MKYTKRVIIFIEMRNNPKTLTAYYKKNKKYILSANKDMWKFKKLQLMNFLCNGNICCQKCSFKDVRALHFDHIENDGFIERKKFKGATQEMRFYFKYPQKARGKLQVLCSNCNWLKRNEL